MRSKHSRKERPEYSPELTTTAFSLSVQAVAWMSTSVSSAGAITWRIGSPNRSANSWSRSSWPGTDMTAPVP